MAYELSWLVENRVIYENLAGNLTLDELREVGKLVGEYVATGTPFVHLLADLTQVGKFPMNLREINNIFENPYPDRFGWMVGVTNNQVVRFFGTMIPQLQGARIRMFASADEALRFLQSVDETLPKLDASLIKKTVG